VAAHAVRRRVFEDSTVDEQLASQNTSDLPHGAFARALKLVFRELAEVERLPPRRCECMGCVLPVLGSIALQNIGAFNKTGGNAPAMLIVIPAIIIEVDRSMLLASLINFCRFICIVSHMHVQQLC
jgi:hypothetical protein